MKISILLLLLYTINVHAVQGNNPSNIRSTKIQWNGEVPCKGEFECFSSGYYGIRAMYKNLYSYIHKWNKNTIRKIMTRWSPPHENNTEMVIRKMSRYLGVHPNERIPMTQDFLINLGRMIIRMEYSYNPYSISQHRDVIKGVFNEMISYNVIKTL